MMGSLSSGVSAPDAAARSAKSQGAVALAATTFGRFGGGSTMMKRASEAADYSVKIVGESYRQDALEEICGGRDTESADLTATARLVREDDNAHDDRAVKVIIQGRHVGWRRSSL